LQEAELPRCEGGGFLPGAGGVVGEEGVLGMGGEQGEEGEEGGVEGCLEVGGWLEG